MIALPFLACVVVGFGVGFVWRHHTDQWDAREWRRTADRLARVLRWHDDGSDPATVDALDAYDGLRGEAEARR